MEFDFFLFMLTKPWGTFHVLLHKKKISIFVRFTRFLCCITLGMNTTQKNEKNENVWHCVDCDFKCSYKSDYNRHLRTVKHKYNKNTTNTTKIQQPKVYYCECGRAYKHRASLFNHKKTCTLS